LQAYITVSQKGLKAKKMKRDDWDFMERINLDLEARRMAGKILGVKETASKKELKKAFRYAFFNSSGLAFSLTLRI